MNQAELTSHIKQLQLDITAMIQQMNDLRSSIKELENRLEAKRGNR